MMLIGPQPLACSATSCSGYFVGWVPAESGNVVPHGGMTACDGAGLSRCEGRRGQGPGWWALRLLEFRGYPSSSLACSDGPGRPSLIHG